MFEYVPGEGPLLISFPHSGTFVPPELAARLRPEALDLPDTDWFVPQLYDFVRDLGASIIRATHTRYVVDLNRPPDGAPLYPGQRETTVCPIETFGGEPLYLEGANPTPGEIDERLYSYWRPYHDKLAGLTRHLAERHGHCILWDAHSILSEVPAPSPDVFPISMWARRRRCCSPLLSERIVACLSAQSISHSWSTAASKAATSPPLRRREAIEAVPEMHKRYLSGARRVRCSVHGP